MRLHLSALAAALSICSPGVFGPAAAYGQSASPCFEIIAPHPRGEPRSPVLIDKCSGSTWLLTRTRATQARAAYHWQPLQMADRRVDAAEPRPATSPRPAAAAAKGNCFTFQNRRYCE